MPQAAATAGAGPVSYTHLDVYKRQVSDQVSRLRRLIGDPEGKFLNVFRSTCGETVRRPQFGMYTGRTPYPGNEPVTSEDRKLEKTLARMSFPQTDSEKSFFEALRHEGKIPAKMDMQTFLEGLHNGRHIPCLLYTSRCV